jgi:DNA-binding transcriptional MerR regulator
MKLKIRASPPKLYTTAAAARELGISAATLRHLEQKRVVRPRRAHDTVRALRIFDEQDLQKVLAHYECKGGVRVLPKN